MSGFALTCLESRRRVGVHALNGGTSHAFVHAPNTRTAARCIDLPWAGDAQAR